MLKHGHDTFAAVDEYAHLKEGRASAAARSAIWAGLNSVVPSVVAAAVFTISSRFLTPAEFGVVALSSGIVAFAGAIAPAGFGQALVQRDRIDKTHVDSVFWLCVVAAVLIYAVLLVGASHFAHLLEEPELAILVSVIGLRVIFDLSAVVPNAFLARTMSFKKLAIRSTIASLVGGSVCLSLLALGHTIWALAFAQLAASVAMFTSAILSVRWRPGLQVNLNSLAEIARFGSFSSGHKILNQLNLDQILVGTLLGTSVLGFYAFARRIYQLLSDAISGALNNVSYTLLSSLQNEKQKLADAFLLSTFVSSALSFPIFVGLAAVSPELVPLLFGTQWIDAVPVLQLFCFIGMMTCIGVIQGALINSQGHAGWWLGYMTVKQLTTVVVIFVCYRFGVAELMLGICCLTACLWPAAVSKTLRIIDMNCWVYLRSFAAPLAASLSMLPVIAAVGTLGEQDMSYFILVSKVIAGALTYALMMAILSGRELAKMYSLLAKTRQMKL